MIGLAQPKLDIAWQGNNGRNGSAGPQGGHTHAGYISTSGGDDIGPALIGIATRQPRADLLELIIHPNKKAAPGFERVLVRMTNGMLYAGIVKREINAELELNSPEDGIVKLNKSEIKSREKGLSAMLPDRIKVLSRKDPRDLVAFLAGLK
ncbi:MAG: hypothetical protein HY298_03680 [Verrucomicrobia bacterium]|nr:hypothetical protein [Verrucomicrobiota bacterium]